MGQYRLSRKAAEDLDRIWDYTVKEWSEEQAISYYRQIHQAVISLSSHTNISGRPYEHIREGLLGYHVNRHIIFVFFGNDVCCFAIDCDISHVADRTIELRVIE